MKKLFIVLMVLSATQANASIDCDDLVDYLQRSRELSAKISDMGDLSKLDSTDIVSLSQDVYDLTSELSGLGSIEATPKEFDTIKSVGKILNKKNAAVLLRQSELQKINKVRTNLINKLAEQRDSACKSLKSD